MLRLRFIVVCCARKACSPAKAQTTCKKRNCFKKRQESLLLFANDKGRASVYADYTWINVGELYEYSHEQRDTLDRRTCFKKVEKIPFFKYLKNKLLKYLRTHMDSRYTTLILTLVVFVLPKVPSNPKSQRSA